MGKCKITVLCENTAMGPMGIIGEHGFSALIEKDEETILFDTGQGMSLANNAQILQVDLSKVYTIVLSHGHYDHTGGLPAALHPPRGVEIIAHPDIFAPKYAQIGSEQEDNPIFVGLKYRREFLEDTFKAHFHFLNQFQEIKPRIYYSGEVPRKTDFEYPDTRLKIKKQGQLVLDPLYDDISLLIETDSGPVVLLGCAHSGVINVLNHFSEKTGYSKFHAAIGGTHLGFMDGPGEQLNKSIQALDAYDLDLIAVSHCTGQEGAAICYNHFKERFAFASAGWSKSF